MFGALGERTIQIVRGALVLGWLIIIASLFYDPWTAALTDPTNTTSPFRINRESARNGACPIWVRNTSGVKHIDWQGFAVGECDPRCTRLQRRCLVQEPYALGARVFWTMILPLVPVFLMVFGHEAWRRICPLSAVSQIPRWLGRQRISNWLNQRTGRVERKLALLNPDGFLARNALLLQFGLLCAGVSTRLLFINSDRTSLGVFFLSVIALAITVGFFWGGKTWCHAFCPLAPMQKILTEPRGLLESESQFSTGSVTQSMCRRAAPDGPDVSTCVGCISPCPDINLERQYWNDLTRPGRRFVHYGYVGMIWGFYGYYALYAGDFQYYFSGAWTHEHSQLVDLFAPGFFLNGVAIPIPKLIAAPLTIALAVLLANALGRGLENLWVYARRRKGQAVGIEERLHKVFALSTVAAFASFYMFAGRPNVSLMPSVARAALDALLVAVCALWLARTWTRTADRYQREAAAGGLRRQLKVLDLNLDKALGKRNLDELNVDEVYALARALPAFSAEQQRTAYRAALRDAIERGNAQTRAGAELLEQLRSQLSIDDDVHVQILAELGIDDPTALSTEHIGDQELHFRISGYRESVAALLDRLLASGTDLFANLARPEVRAEIERLQAAYRISDDEHVQVMAEFEGNQSTLVRRANAQLSRLTLLEAWHSACLKEEAECMPLLRSEIEREQERELQLVFNVLVSLGEDSQAVMIARLAAARAKSSVIPLLDRRSPTDSRNAGLRWRDVIHATVVQALEQQAQASLRVNATPRFGLRTEAGRSALQTVAHEWRPVARAIALAVLAELHPQAARALATQVLEGGVDARHGLVREVAAAITRPPAAADHERTTAALPQTLLTIRKLHSTELFARADLESLVSLAESAELRVLLRGETICRQGDLDEQVFCLTAGQADVFIDSHTGPLRIGTLQPGESIGELRALTGKPRSATVIANDESTEIVCLDSRTFDLYVQRDARHVLRLLSHRLLGATQRISDNATPSAS